MAENTPKHTCLNFLTDRNKLYHCKNCLRLDDQGVNPNPDSQEEKQENQNIKKQKINNGTNKNTKPTSSANQDQEEARAKWEKKNTTI